MSEKQVVKIYAEAGFLVPMEQISKSTVETALSKFHRRFYVESRCQKCPYMEDRHSENCDNCESFLGARMTAKKVVFKGKEHLSVPRGHRKFVERLISKDQKVESVRFVAAYRKLNEPMKRRIKEDPSMPMRPYQNEAIEAAILHKKGIIKSPPRSGKTAIASVLICRVGMKAIILAHQREWLIQFQETFLGSKTQKGFTNARPDQIGLAKTEADFEKYDVCLCTFAQFFSPRGKALLAKIRNKFGVVVQDECHKGAALATSRVLAQFNAEYVVGLSGTPARKCFHPSTVVRMNDSSTKVITEVSDGDQVLSPLGGPDTVASFFKREYSGTMVNVTLGSGKSVQVTPDHLILTQVGWVQAIDLDPSFHMVASE